MLSLPFEACKSEGKQLPSPLSGAGILIGFYLGAWKTEIWRSDIAFGELTRIHVADAGSMSWPPCLSKDVGLGATKKRKKTSFAKQTK